MQQSSKNISCYTVKNCAKIKIQQWQSIQPNLYSIQQNQAYCRRHHLSTSALHEQVSQFRLVWLLSPLISVFSCCSARACHFCLFFLQPSSKGKQSSDTWVKASYSCKQMASMNPTCILGILFFFSRFIRSAGSMLSSFLSLSPWSKNSVATSSAI